MQGKVQHIQFSTLIVFFITANISTKIYFIFYLSLLYLFFRNQSMNLPPHKIPNGIFNMIPERKINEYVSELPKAMDNLNACRMKKQRYVETLKKALYFEESEDWIKLVEFNASNIRLEYLEKREFYVTESVSNLLVIYYVYFMKITFSHRCKFFLHLQEVIKFLVFYILY